MRSAPTGRLIRNPAQKQCPSAPMMRAAVPSAGPPATARISAESAAPSGLFRTARLTYLCSAWLIPCTAHFPQTRGTLAICGLGQERTELADLFTES
jgi:hypothetical protein